MIELDDVSLERDGRQVLRGLTMRLTERRIGVIGANGSGKSSFARLLNGLVLPSTGSVRVFGKDTGRETRAVRRAVGFLFQNPDHQIVYPTVEEDLAFGLKKAALSKRAASDRVDAALAGVGLAGQRSRLIQTLSGGERQLVALAGVTIMEPRMIVLDEPTALLDLRNTRRVMAALDGAGSALVMLTHDLSLLAGWERVLVLEAGRLAYDGRPRDAIEFYRDLVA